MKSGCNLALQVCLTLPDLRATPIFGTARKGRACPKISLTCSEAGRDARGHRVSVGFLARAEGGPSAASDASDAAFLDPSSTELAFDHEGIIADALAAPPSAR